MLPVRGAEVAKHATKSSCWIVLHGQVWDVTSFLNDHPGGVNTILKLAGQDATAEYEQVHNASLVSETLAPTALLGSLDSSTAHQLRAPTTQLTTKPRDPSTPPPLSSLISVNDFSTIAHTHLPPSAWAYYASGSDSQHSLRDPARLYRLLKLRPRVLRDVTSISTSTSILGHQTSLPIYASPTGLGGFAHREAECAIARVTGKERVVQVVPHAPSRGHEEIRAAGREVGGEAGGRWGTVQFLQLYVNTDREKVEGMVRMAERLGYAALWVTVDSPVLGKREMDERVKMRELVESGGLVGVEGAGMGVAKAGSSGLLNPGLTWEVLEWVRGLTGLPVVIKGIQSVEDAVLAYEKGYRGIVLSNHGGRSVDTAQAPIVTLLEIRRYAPQLLEKDCTREGGRFEVYVDGGIRRGTDVLKALALGAAAVGVGRPFLYSMAAGYGEEGIRRMVSILRAELETNMALVGASKIWDLEADMVNSKRAELEVIDGLSVKL